MDLVSPKPQCDLYDAKWPIRTYQGQAPPAKTISTDEEADGEELDGVVLNSILAGGCLIKGGHVNRSVLSHHVRIERGAKVERSVFMEGVNVGPAARIRNAIIDQDVTIPEGFSIGYDREQDEKLFTISPGGVVIVPKRVILG